MEMAFGSSARLAKRPLRARIAAVTAAPRLSGVAAADAASSGCRRRAGDHPPAHYSTTMTSSILTTLVILNYRSNKLCRTRLIRNARISGVFRISMRLCWP